MSRSPKKSTLIVEDHPQTIYAVRPVLQNLQLEIETATSVASATEKLATRQYDLVVLDRNLPDGDGLELISQLVESSLAAKVLVLSERGDVVDRVQGLELGADDYLPKPFSAAELRARVSALLRRANSLQTTPLTFLDIQYFPSEHLLVIDEHQQSLSPKLGRFLEVLIRQPGHLITRQKLAATVWTEEKFPQESSIDTLASRLRRALQESSVTIKSKPLVGYELVAKK